MKNLLDILSEALDNDTLIIVGLIIVALVYKEDTAVVSAIIGGFLGYIRGTGSP